MTRKLTDFDITVIRRSYSDNVRIRVLALVFGVSETCIWYKINGRKVAEKAMPEPQSHLREDHGGQAPLAQPSSQRPLSYQALNRLHFRRRQPVRSSDEEEDRKKIAEHIARHGVTRCPPGVAYGAYDVDLAS